MVIHVNAQKPKRKRRLRRRPIPDVPAKSGLFLLPKAKFGVIEFTLSSVPITGTARKLRARWSVDDPPPTETHTNEHGVTYHIWR